MGAKLSRCLGIDQYIRVREDYGVHPGMVHDPERLYAVALEVGAEEDENPESFFS